MDIDNIIRDINSGKERSVQYYLDFFPDAESLIEYIDHHGKLGELDTMSLTFRLKLDQGYLNYIKNHNKKLFVEWVQNTFNDLKFMDGEFYLVVPNLSVLSNFFCKSKGGRDIKRFVWHALKGESVFEFPTEDDDYLYDDIFSMIQSLDRNNLEHFKKIIIFHLKDKEIKPLTDVLQIISDKQRKGEYIEINENNVDLVLSDKQTLQYILDILEDLFNSLQSLYISSYESSMNDEYYDSIIDELSPYFDMNNIIYDNVMDEQFLKIINFDYLFEFVEETFGSYEMLSWGGFTELLSNSIECLTVNFPEYPDSKSLEILFNEYFTSEIN